MKRDTDLLKRKTGKVIFFHISATSLDRSRRDHDIEGQGVEFDLQTVERNGRIGTQAAKVQFF